MNPRRPMTTISDEDRDRMAREMDAALKAAEEPGRALMRATDALNKATREHRQAKRAAEAADRKWLELAKQMRAAGLDPFAEVARLRTP